MNYLRAWVNQIERDAYFEIGNFHINLRLKKKYMCQLMEFCNSYILCLRAFFAILCASTTVYVSERDLLLGLLLVSLCVQCRTCWVAVSRSERRFDTLKVTAADLLQVSEATSGLSESISPHDSDLWAAQTYLGYRKKQVNTQNSWHMFESNVWWR